MVLQIISELRGFVSPLAQLIGRVRNATNLCEKFSNIVFGLWKFLGFFGCTAAGALVYEGVVTIFDSSSSEGDIFIENTPRAPSEAPRPLLLQ